MDIKMEDAGKAPESHEGGAVVEAPSISTLDGWIENLMACKQLSETDVQRLCDKVSCVFGLNRPVQAQMLPKIRGQADTTMDRLARFCRKSLTCSQWYISKVQFASIWF